MAKKDPKALREEAKKLLEKARALENERALKIGKLVMSYEEKGFDGITIDDIKKKIAEI